jgi:Flp pilus assembly protein TadD
MRPFFEADRHIEQGLQAIKDKRFVIAEEHFRRALELRPEDAGALEGLRLALNKKKSLFGRTRKKD